jgi:iron complex outermembrane receptor protein
VSLNLLHCHQRVKCVLFSGANRPAGELFRSVTAFVQSRIGNLSGICHLHRRWIGLKPSILYFIAALSLYAGSGDNGQHSATDLSSMSIEQLMNVSATSILKTPDKPSQASAAIYVITAEDIRRSGMTSIPELLRLVPGMDVGRVNTTTWSISSRGFGNESSDKMLVLIDGRRVYDPLIAGVFWDAQDVPLYDIAQIEVIRGSGSSLWGADAVNGVINIITKSARDTQGAILETGGGNLDGTVSSAQYGGKIGKNTYYRIFGKYDRQDLPAADASPSHVGPIGTERGGFRVDSDLTDRDLLTVLGDSYSGTIADIVLASEGSEPTNQRNGTDLLARWTHRLVDGSETTLQIYWDNTNRTIYDCSDLRNTVDIDFEHQLTVKQRHNVIWGVRGDYGYEHGASGSVARFSPARLGFKVFDGFVQDEIPFADNRFHLVAGSKFEHNDYTGFEWQPNLRLAFTPDDNQTAWVAVSRGVVDPSQENRSIEVNIPPTVLQPGTPLVSIAYSGNPALTSQDLLAYEGGYRKLVGKSLLLDLVGFYDVYSHLETAELGVPSVVYTPELYIVEPYVAGNKMAGTSHGLELSASWKVLERWKLTGSYSWLDMQLHLLPGSTDNTSLAYAGESPRHQFQIHSFLDLPHKLELDTSLYFTSSLPTWNIAPYTRLDIRAGWRWNEHFEFSLVGQNLSSRKHLEAMAESELPPTSIPRSFFGRITWRF